MNDTILSTLIGGGLALAGSGLTLAIQRYHSKSDQKEAEIDLLKSIQCEVKNLATLMKDKHGEFLEERVGAEGYVEAWFTVNQNYFAYFDQNYAHFPKIKCKELRLKIQKSVLYGKSYIDTVVLHNQLISSLIEYGIRHDHTNDAYDLEKYEQNLEMIKDFDTHLMMQAKLLYGEQVQLVDDIEKYVNLKSSRH